VPYLGVVQTDRDATADADQSSDELSADPSDDVAAFVAAHGERLRRVLVAGYGVEVGNDICADALAYCCEHWDRVRGLDNPAGYLYRVAQTAARRHRRWSRTPVLPAERRYDEEPTDPDLGAALGSLRRNQRMCVVLVHVYDWTYQQTADALDMPITSVRNHVHRGLAALRKILEP
jgi:DNA-directed RNA polymerase specialized sigma24 family protein